MNDDLPQQIRARLADPISLCQALGFSRIKRQHGGGIWVLCPVHNEKSPSCSVTVGADRTLRWKCFSCGATGDALTLIAVINNLSTSNADFERVLEIGANLAGIHVDRERPAQPRQIAPRWPEPVPDPDAVDNDAFAKVIAPLAHIGRLDGSLVSVDVCRYLDGRGLLQAAKADGWFAIAPTAGELVCSVFGVELVARCGLVDNSGQLRWPEHSLAIPWRTQPGVVQTIQRRHLGDCDAKRRYVFPTGRGPAQPYGIDRLTTMGPIALVEGAMDVLAWRTSASPTRYETPLGVPGVSGWKSEWDVLVTDRNVLIAYDDDEAGNREVPKLDARFRCAGVARLARATPKMGKDWADGIRRSA